jgi:hypothetical protein
MLQGVYTIVRYFAGTPPEVRKSEYVIVEMPDSLYLYSLSNIHNYRVGCINVIPRSVH